MSNGEPDKLAAFVALEQERRQIETRLEEIRREAALLQDLLLEEWMERGQQNARVGDLSVYVASDFACSKRAGVDTQDLCRTLEAHGLARLVALGYNAQSLKAWAKETIQGGSELPKEIADALNVDTIPRLRTRRA